MPGSGLLCNSSGSRVAQIVTILISSFLDVRFLCGHAAGSRTCTTFHQQYGDIILLIPKPSGNEADAIRAVLSQRLTRDFLEQLSYLLLPAPVDAWLSAVIAVSESM